MEIKEKQPKRRTLKDNPYERSYDPQLNQCFINFTDGCRVQQSIPVTEEIYNTFDEFELMDLSQMNKDYRHISAFSDIDRLKESIEPEKAALKNIQIEKLYA